MSNNHKTNQKTRKDSGAPMGGPGRMMNRIEKPKDFKGAMKNLFFYLKPYRIAIVAVFFLSIASTTFSIISPRIMGNMTNSIVDNYNNIQNTTSLPASPSSYKSVFDYAKLQNFAIILIILYVLSAILGYLQDWVVSGVTQKITYRLRREISQKINRLPLRYFDQKTHGDILSRVSNDVDTISQSLNQSLSQIISAVATLIGISVMMISINWMMTLAAVIVLPPSFALSGIIIKKSQKFFRRQQEQLGKINGHIEEMYAGHNVVKIFNGEKRSIAKFQDINHELFDSAWKSQFLSGFVWPMMAFMGNLGFVGVSMVGGYLAGRGQIKIGDIQAFIQYVRQFNQPTIQIANIASVLQSTAAAAERIFNFLEEGEESADGSIEDLNPQKTGEVKFDNISFYYEQGKPVIKNFNATIRPGQRVAIVGPTGAGKTTIVNLLMRFYDVQEGSILVNGTDIRHIKRSILRKMFGMVLQDAWLMNGTIRENIAYGRPGASEEEIALAAHAAHADQLIHNLPGGYDMQLNEEADNVSQGEKQLITIARAMLIDPSILILDEATSSVDTRTEILIQKAMEKLMHGRTSFVIAHRLSTIQNADLILVMKDGQIIEQGQHKTLLSQNGFYASLYKTQFVTS